MLLHDWHFKRVFLTSSEKSVDFTMQRLVSMTNFPHMYSFMSPHACMRLSGVTLMLLDLGIRMLLFLAVMVSCCASTQGWDMKKGVCEMQFSSSYQHYVLWKQLVLTVISVSRLFYASNLENTLSYILKVWLACVGDGFGSRSFGRSKLSTIFF